MNIRACIVVAMVSGAVSMPVVCQARVEYLKEEPPKGAIPYGKIVYVDDGTCPAGEVKEVTGGSSKKSIPRTVRCAKRPE